MGWLWASSSPRPPSPAQDKPTTDSPSSKTAPNEPSVDPEIQKFLDLISGETSSSSKSEATKPAPPAPSASKPEDSKSEPTLSSWLSLKASRSRSDDSDSLNASPRDALSESLLPSEMSCRQAFDLAWSCNSLGGQWNAVYREGEMRSCSDLWDDFWFCMRQKSYSGATKAEAIRQHYRNREHAKYYAPGQRSSEDIWEAREARLPYGAAFSQSIGASLVSDEEWRRQESERRKEIRQGLGVNGASSR